MKRASVIFTSIAAAAGVAERSPRRLDDYEPPASADPEPTGTRQQRRYRERMLRKHLARKKGS